MNKKVYIKVWNKWSHVRGDSSAIEAVRDFLSYPVVDRYGDTFIYSLLTKNNAFRSGFLPNIVEFLENTYEVEVDDCRDNKFTVTGIVSSFSIGELRESQKDVVLKCFNNESWYRGIINAATNFGKNWVITSQVISTKDLTNVVITIHRQELFNQLFEMLTECGVEVSRWGTYKNKVYRELGNVSLVMYKSMHPYIQKTEVISHMKGVGLLIVDEAHRSQAGMYKKVLSIIDAYSVFYLSGTPYTGDPKRDLEMVGDSGPEIVKITNSDLIESGVSQKPTVYIKELTDFDPFVISYQDEIASMVTSKNKNSFLRELIIKDLDKSTLVVVQYKHHGNFLLNLLMGIGVTVDFVFGDDADRQFKIEAFKNGSIKVLITTEVLKEGVNIPNIRRLVNMSTGSSVVWVKQFVGRLLRSDGINDTCEVYDFLDASVRLRAQSLKRVKLYEKEGFDIKII